MNCFAHQQLTAVAICKCCGKALCPPCVRESPTAITCSEKCADELAANHAMQLIARKTYGVGTAPRAPLGPLLIGMLGLMISVLSAFLIVYERRSLWVGVMMCAFGLLVIFFAVMIYRRGKSAGING
jgi:hypothetical protein